jgi:hypothetical protein
VSEGSMEKAALLSPPPCAQQDAKFWAWASDNA